MDLESWVKLAARGIEKPKKLIVKLMVGPVGLAEEGAVGLAVGDTVGLTVGLAVGRW